MILKGCPPEKFRNIYTNDKDFHSYMCKKQRRSSSARFLSLNSIIIIPLSIIFCYLPFIIIAFQPQPMRAAIIVMFSSSTPSNVTISNNDTNMTSTFHHSYEVLINDSQLLTQNYQSEIGKWRLKQYDNKTMMSVTDNYLPMFQKLVGRLEALNPTTENYIQAKEWYIKSLQSEIESYRHFRNFLGNGSPIEDEKSTQLLSDALRYEFNSFAAFNNQTNNQTPFV